jgi:flagellin
MRELAVQASNDTYEEKDRGEIQKEIDQLKEEIDRIASTTEFNTMRLLNGDRANTFEVTGSAMAAGAQVTDGGLTTALDGTSLANGEYKLEIAKTLANEAYTAEMAVAEDMDYSSLNPGSTAGENFVGGKITITDASSTYLADAGTITLTYDGDAGTLRVVIEGGADEADDLILADEDGNFVFDNHGISFTLKGEGLVDGDVIVANVTDANIGASGIATEQKGFTSHTTASGATASFENGGISVSAEAEAGVWTGVYDSGTNTLTMTFIGEDGTTYEDVIDVSGSTGEYNAHGISFTFNPNDSSAAEFTFTVTNKYNVSATLTNVTTGEVVATETLAEDYTGATSDAIEGSIEGLAFTQTGELMDATHTFTVEQTTTGTDNSLTFQIGSNSKQSMKLDIADMSASALEVDQVKVDNYVDAQAAIDSIEAAIGKVSAERSKLGAVQNRLEHTIRNLDTSAENLQASESRIRDVDMAKEMMEFTKQNILQQAATAMLAQANQAPQSVLQLLR